MTILDLHGGGFRTRILDQMPEPAGRGSASPFQSMLCVPQALPFQGHSAAVLQTRISTQGVPHDDGGFQAAMESGDLDFMPRRWVTNSSGRRISVAEPKLSAPMKWISVRSADSASQAKERW